LTLAARSFGSKGGSIVGALTIEPSVLSDYKNVSAKSIYSNPFAHEETATKGWTKLEELLRNGDIQPLPYKVAGGLAKAAEALKAVKQASGYKVLVHPQE
jgi:hypothetical protein